MQHCHTARFRPPLPILVLACFIAASQAGLANEAGPPPNVVLIVADDLGQGDIGAYGNTRIRTPNLDRLAVQGVTLTQHYASGHVCTPSRAGLMTGRYPIRSGLAALSAAERPGWGLPESEYTLAELLHDAGYATYLVGKWGLGELPASSPLRHGFDGFFGVPNSNDMPGFALYDGDRAIDETVDQSTLTGRYTAAAASFIDAKAGAQPFFLYLAHTFPHIPLFASPAFAGKSAAGRYGDVVEELDASVGQIVAALRDHGILDNTLIVFTSDNGPFFEGDPGPAHGGKGSTWDGGYRVPFIASWPGRFPAGRIAAQISMNIDILPTLAQAAGVGDLPLPLDGRSVLGVLQGDEDEVHQHLLFFAAEEIVGIRDAQWKLVTHAWFRSSFVAFEKLDQLDGFRDPYALLFDMTNGPGERYSLADREPGVTQRLVEALAAARSEFNPLRLEPPSRTFPE